MPVFRGSAGARIPYTFSMLCESCGEREATFHEVVVRQGKVGERHLCELCARRAAAEGMSQTGASPAESPAETVEKLVTGLVLGKHAPAPATPKVSTCPDCGLTYAQFRDRELLGCATCYDAFERQLSPLLERTHEGATHHVGKTPRGALERRTAEGGEESVLGDVRERAARIATLRKQLDEALHSEKYERAAILRDEIHKLSSGTGAPGDEGDEQA